MKIVSIDLSTKFIAFALWDNGELVETGKIYPRGTLDEGIGSFAELIEAKFFDQEVDRVVYEAAFLGRNVNVIKALSKATGAMIGGFYLSGVNEFVAIPPITWQTGIGVGRTTPEEMKKLKRKYAPKSATWIKNRDRENRKQLIIDFVNNEYALSLSMDDNDIADAIGVGHFYLSKEYNGV